jgi:hypothetical protein
MSDPLAGSIQHPDTLSKGQPGLLDLTLGVREQFQASTSFTQFHRTEAIVLLHHGKDGFTRFNTG